jgi:site-specific DNA-methyltransferase (adenine-specific)
VQEPLVSSGSLDSSPAAPVNVTLFDLHHDDCVRGMRKLPGQSIDLVVTSPPYNLGVRYSRFSDCATRADYLCWCKGWAAEIARVLKRSGSFFLNVGSSPSNPLLPHELVLELRELFVVQNTIHWIKSIAIDRATSKTEPRVSPLPKRDEDERRHVTTRATTYGHFKPISSKRFLNDCHEYIFHFTKTGFVEIDRLALGVPYQDKTNIARWSHTHGSDRRCRGNTWFIPYQTIQRREKDRPHPASFPMNLPENCIRLHGLTQIETMLDPFLGIGNSAVAARNCGVPKFIGFEIDENYLAEAKRRIAATSP